MMRTYRKFSVLSVLVRSNPYCGLQRTRQITFLRVHIKQLRPWLDRIPRCVQRPLEHFLRFLLMVKSQSKITENFPFQSCLAVCHVLGFEVCYFGAEDRPNTEVLGVM
jgi:hypothetical protein